jgi:hypothetical protein
LSHRVTRGAWTPRHLKPGAINEEGRLCPPY